MKNIIYSLRKEFLHIFDLFNSIEVLSNPILNLILKIGILLIAITIVISILKKLFSYKEDKKYKPYNEHNNDTTYTKVITKPQTIDDCISSEDIKYQLNRAEEDIINTIERNKKQIADTIKKANKTLDIAWLDSCDKIYRIANTLDNNLIYYSQRNLEMSKFQYYAHLHFRSMLAANIVYQDYEKMNKSFEEVNKFIVNMKSNPIFKGEYKTQVHNSKDQIKAIRKLYLDRIHEMNHQTEILRDKIGAECGKKGYYWWLERTRHKR